MKFKSIYFVFFSLLTISFAVLLVGYSSGPAATVQQGYTGAPGETGTVCGTCHNADNYGAVSVDLVSNIGTLPYEYVIEYAVPMDITVNAASGSPAGYGFQLIMTNSQGVPLDVEYTNLGANVKQSTLPNGRTYVEHNGISTSNVFSFDYNILYSSELDYIVKVYVAATAVNADGFNLNDSGSNSFEFNLLPFVFPVELTKFEATPKKTSVQLDWTTETEQDNDYFALEHSADGTDFRTIKTIKGAGTSDERHSYSYTHTDPVNGNNYYRLRQVDFDGKENFSEVATAKFRIKFDDATAFPQPASTEATVYFASLAEVPGTMEVYDISGRLIHSNIIQLMEGDNYLTVNCADWLVGHYVIYIRGERIGEEAVHFLKK